MTKKFWWENVRAVEDRCKACYPCPMLVVGCDSDAIPHGHGGSQTCSECGVPFYEVHPHSEVCSKGTPILPDKIHDGYHMKHQLEWKKLSR